MDTIIQAQPSRREKCKKCSKKYLLQYAQQLLSECKEVLLQPDVDNFETVQLKEQFRHYFITNDQQEQVLSATVESVFCIRIGFGQIIHSQLGMKTLYPIGNKYDVMHLHRSLSCSCCFCPISLEVMEIYAPPDQYFARVEQKCDVWNAVFHVTDATGSVVMYISGQNMKMDMFKVLNEVNVVVGTIRLKTFERFESSGLQRREAYHFYFEGSEAHKLMLLGATFLIERIYWDTPKCLRKHEWQF